MCKGCQLRDSALRKLKRKHTLERKATLRAHRLSQRRLARVYRSLTIVPLVLVLGVLMWSYQELQGDAVGTYYPGADVILIKAYDHQNTEHVMGTAMHEVGHHVYWEKMTQEERERWNNISNASKPEEFITDYARTDPAEDFAESYEAVMRIRYDPGELYGVSYEKAEFMESLFWGRRFDRPKAQS